MTDLILSLATQFWPMTVFIILVIIGLIINLFDIKIWFLKIFLYLVLLFDNHQESQLDRIKLMLKLKCN